MHSIANSFPAIYRPLAVPVETCGVTSTLELGEPLKIWVDTVNQRDGLVRGVETQSTSGVLDEAENFPVMFTYSPQM